MKRLARWLALTLVVAGAGGGGYKYWEKRRARAMAPTFVPVPIGKGDLLISVQATGTVQPENRLVIKPPINGRIDSIKVKEGEAVRKDQVLAMMSSTDRAALLDMARAKGPEEVKHWEEIYRSTPIVAPLAGVIIQRNVEPGQVIATTDQVFSMSDHLICVAQVDETDMAKVRLGQEVSIVLDAYPTEHVIGHVSLIAFDARTVSSVTIYDVQIMPEKVPEFMRSGMTASVQFKVDEHKGVLLAPAAAVKIDRTDKGRATVLVRKEDGEGHGKDERPTEQEVRIGLTDGKSVEIVSGLAAGDTIQQEVVKLPEAKNGGSPFSPGGGNKSPPKR